MSLITDGYGPQAGLIITDGYGNIVLISQIPESCIARVAVKINKEVKVKAKIVYTQRKGVTNKIVRINSRITYAQRKNMTTYTQRKSIPNIIVREVRPCQS